MKTTAQQIEFLNRRIADGGFLQSEEWRAFQESTGKRMLRFESDGCFANVIEHTLPWVGKYWYIPRGPIVSNGDAKGSDVHEKFLADMVAKARQESIGWVRIEPADEFALRSCEKASGRKAVKAPHDMQPKELFIIPITNSEQDILSRMKSKTRYNVRLAEKKGVKVFVSREQKYIDAFCDLVEVTAKRDGIVPHPRSHYRKMLQTVPEDMLRLYVAEYEGKIVAANLAVFFGKYATYLHGASGNEYREVMAPYLLQWRQIQDARTNGCEHYDFGGVKSLSSSESTQESGEWAGITRFKQGFLPSQSPTVFMGTYDLVVRKNRYRAYLLLQILKKLYKNFRKIS